mgnify:CR=1 FL=1
MFKLCDENEFLDYLDFNAVDLDSRDNTDEKELTIGRCHSFPPDMRVRLLFGSVDSSN